MGKAATLCLFYAFPLLLLGAYAGDAALVAKVVGWAFVALGHRPVLVRRPGCTWSRPGGSPPAAGEVAEPEQPDG